MRMVRNSVVLFVTALVAVALAAEPSGTLTVKTSEDPEAMVNTDAKTMLQVTIAIPRVALESGVEYDIRVEIHNPPGAIEIVYMPGLTFEPVFTPAKYGHVPLHGRMSAKDERLNFVVLMGGDSYARTYRWMAPGEGQVTFKAVYLNKRNGAEIGVKAWTGEIRSQSRVINITRQKKAEQGAAAAADKPRR